MRRTRQRLLVVASAALLSVFGVQGVDIPVAEAAKVRKKPPKQPLPPHQPSPDVEPSPPDAGLAPSTAVGSTQSPTPEIPYPQSNLVCFYGEETDPSTKKVRCLAPEELNPPRLVIVNSRPLAEKLGMLARTSRLPVPDGDAGGDAGDPDGGVVVEPTSAFEARVVRVSFENGAVGGALRSLRSRTDEMAKCVEDEGGLRTDSARLKLLFFVRADRKASGMIVASARNIPVPVVRCIREVITEGTVGQPSTVPVGVTVLIELKQNE